MLRSSEKSVGTLLACMCSVCSLFTIYHAYTYNSPVVLYIVSLFMVNSYWDGSILQIFFKTLCTEGEPSTHSMHTSDQKLSD